jgi:SAM-dependent methyltransferase
MSATCPIGFDVERLREEIRDTYGRVAARPEGDFHFHRGPGYAARLLGYDPEELRALPEASTRRFAGVGNPHRVAPLRPGMTVLDVGCGAGMDLLLAARRVAPTGRAIGVDMTPAMREVARGAGEAAGLCAFMEVREGMAERLPVADASVDVVLSNGVLNLIAEKEAVFREMHRVLRPGGRLQIADVLLDRDLHRHERDDVELWAGCVAGALLESEAVALARTVGFREVLIVERFDCFRDTPVAGKVSPVVGVHGANLYGIK